MFAVRSLAGARSLVPRVLPCQVLSPSWQEPGGRRQELWGRRQELGGRRQELGGRRQLATSSCRAIGDSRSERKRKYTGRLEYLNRGDPFEQTVAGQEVETYQLQADRLQKESRVYVWGAADWGALGSPALQQPRNPRHAPVAVMWRPIMAKLGETMKLTDAAAGYGFSLFLTDKKDQPVWGCGVNSSGQLGYFRRRNPEGREVGEPLEVLLEAGHIPLPLREGEKVEAVAAGRAHSLVLTSHGEVLSLGDNSHGQCGRAIVAAEDYSVRRPVHRMDTGGHRVTAVVAGQDHSLLVTSEGRVLACGWGADGQTGQGHYRSGGELGQVRGDLEGEVVTKVACAGDCVLALSSSGEVFGWGNSEYGQFSSVTEEQQLCSATHLPLALGSPCTDLASGGTVCLALTQEGSTWVWGYGVLGLGPRVDSLPQPQEIPPVLFGRNVFTPDCRVTAVFAGLGHQAAVTSSGDLYTWGRNRSSCLGLGTRDTVDQPFPLKVAVGGKVTSAKLGVDHSIAVVRSWMSK